MFITRIHKTALLFTISNTRQHNVDLDTLLYPANISCFDITPIKSCVDRAFCEYDKARHEGHHTKNVEIITGMPFLVVLCHIP